MSCDPHAWFTDEASMRLQMYNSYHEKSTSIHKSSKLMKFRFRSNEACFVQFCPTVLPPKQLFPFEPLEINEPKSISTVPH